MPRGDGVHRAIVRNEKISDKAVSKVQAHNERAKESYSNQDIILERTEMNVHFKTPTSAYIEMFQKMVSDGMISVRGLKADACKFGELIFDVNSEYFNDHGGYDFAKKFYADAYKAAIKIVGDEKYILSAVLHVDERNRALSDLCGQDVYHYHLHVVYVPIVEKEIRWTARCKDRELIGKVKEFIMQVSMSKKWASMPVLDEDGNPMRTQEGKVIYKSSYSMLQDTFFNYMQSAGYVDVERGERGSTEEHLTVTQFKVLKEQERLAKLREACSDEKENFDRVIEDIRQKKLDLDRIDDIKAKPALIGNKVSMEQEDFNMLITAAKKYVIQEKKESALQKALDIANRLIAELKNIVSDLKQKLSDAYKEICDINSENDRLQKRIYTYEDAISRNGLQPYFIQEREKEVMQEEER